MRPHSDELAQVLTGSFDARLIADVFYGAERTFEDLPVGPWELGWDSGANIKSGGSLTVEYTSDVADSLSPREFTDALAPFGQELNLLMEVSAGEFRETVQLGHYRISAVPDARDEHMQLLGRTLTVGSRVSLTLMDRMVAVERAGFRSEQTPPSLASCWAEIQRLTGMQIIESLPDKPIPTSLVYLAEQNGRLKAVQQLAQTLGGVPYITPDGAISVLPDAPGPVVGELTLGESGTILDVAHSMESDRVFNEVVGNFEDEQRNPIYAVKAITDGPLSINGPYGPYTHYYSSSSVKTQVAADAAVAAVLAQVSSTQTYRVPVTCVVNPLIEDGDVVTVERPEGGKLTGRVATHKFDSSNTMSLELDVQRNVG